MTIEVSERPAAVHVPLPRHVEVETSRRCNRTCSWCPNGENNARRIQELMDFTLYRRIVGELAELDYAGYLAFHNYNEPLLNRRILDEIAYAKAAMPNVRPAIYTNGDVLDYAFFDRLIRAGVTYIRVTRYPHRADTPPSFNTVQGWLRRAGLLDEYQWQYRRVRQGLAAVMDGLGFKAEVISPEITGVYNNRGGSVTTLPVLTRKRTEPCLMTATSAVIDYRGRMKMCCCVYPEIPAHTGYVVGDLRTARFADLWESAQMNGYREAHARADWSLSPACATCVQPLPETRQ
ncbi:radical SAM/SPASM domain-containing protein [Plantactinospora sp. KLBMP9567]|uniref:radical SAM/SPASM domain-containing protein n=1 Tax=Plantactinospora sp. KLBMP9567 TaxID=3085900 RepID=UPI00298174D4|nr:radical SAM protein [Plantactinospora sp. KLBMP9567]MDW5324256.1 radical SAM protein [Plantactinospora sp. KLBMP9567]